ncbi:PAS domain-containing protein [Dongia sp.]|uniref:PAS domain-containing protein n=1 Tax=Dongia sp. TaxID=1977262 RepID=UPI003753324C
MTPKPSTVRAVELDIDCKRYPEIDRILAYWRAKKGDREFPSRADIDPLEFTRALPRVMMVEVSYDSLEFRYRVAGTGLFAMHGRDLTGKLARELEPPEFGALIHRHYAEAIERRAPILHLIELTVDYLATSYARIILPLSIDGKVIDRLITCEAHEDHALALQKFFRQAKA